MAVFWITKRNIMMNTVNNSDIYSSLK